MSPKRRLEMAAWLGGEPGGARKLESSRDGGLMLLKYDHAWDPLRSDPRFQQLVRRVGLPD